MAGVKRKSVKGADAAVQSSLKVKNDFTSNLPEAIIVYDKESDVIFYAIYGVIQRAFCTFCANDDMYPPMVVRDTFLAAANILEREDIGLYRLHQWVVDGPEDRNVDITNTIWRINKAGAMVSFTETFTSVGYVRWAYIQDEDRLLIFKPREILNGDA